MPSGVHLIKGLTRVFFACFNGGTPAHDQGALGFFFRNPGLLDLLERDKRSFLLARLSFFVVARAAVGRYFGATDSSHLWLLFMTKRLAQPHLCSCKIIHGLLV